MVKKSFLVSKIKRTMTCNTGWDLLNNTLHTGSIFCNPSFMNAFSVVGLVELNYFKHTKTSLSRQN